MATCRVSFTDRDGIHSVEVQGETLYEAVAEAIAEFRQDSTVPNQPAPETEFRVQVLKKPVEHLIKMRRVMEWAQFSNAKGPADVLLKERVRKLLAS